MVKLIGASAISVVPSRANMRVPLQVDEQVEVARRRTADARFAFAGDADAGAVIDARREC